MRFMDIFGNGPKYTTAIDSQIGAYYAQWLGVATNGNVKFDKALDVPERARLRCTKCGSGHTFSLDLNNPQAVPHDAQQFVQFHAHKGGSRFCPTCGTEVTPIGFSGTVATFQCPAGCRGADAAFLKETEVLPVRPKLQDTSPHKSAEEDIKIQKIMEKYQKELEAKKAELALKVAELQTEKAKLDAQKLLNQHIYKEHPVYVVTKDKSLVPMLGAKPGQIIPVNPGDIINIDEVPLTPGGKVFPRETKPKTGRKFR